MPRPSTEAEYLASLVPPSARGFSRRTLLRGAVGAGSLLAVPGLLAACGGGDTSTSGSSGAATAGATGTVSLGSNGSDAAPKAALQDVVDAFQKANSGLTVNINTIDHNSFQENINNYLQGSPDDVFTWFSGYRMRFFAAQGLAGDISDVWQGKSNMSDALKSASTGDDGKQYFMPSTNYRGRSSTARASGRRRATRSRRPSTTSRPSAPRCRRTACPRSPSATRTAGRRWAPSTSSTCASTATIPRQPHGR